MRCQTARKRISDDLDGRLDARRRAGLEGHLEGCRSCRDYRRDLESIQAEAGLPQETREGFWTDFERRLEARLDAATPGRARVAVPFAPRRRWAWAAAAAATLAGISLWLALPRPVPPLAEAWLPTDDILDPLVRAAEADPDLAGRIDREIRASMEEFLPSRESSEALLPAADPLFWESLSDDDLRAVVATLEKESGLGGPQ
jgi:anti-sigma factor RsiW